MSHPLVTLARLFDFGGRSRRSETLPFLALTGGAVALAAGWDAHMDRADVVAGVAGPLTVIVALLLALPLAATLVRRVHDGGRPATVLAVLLVPVIGVMVVVRWLIAPGVRGANRFGIDPKGEERRTAPPEVYPFRRA